MRHRRSVPARSRDWRLRAPDSVNVHSGNFAVPSHMAHLASGPGNVFNAAAVP